MVRGRTARRAIPRRREAGSATGPGLAGSISSADHSLGIGAPRPPEVSEPTLRSASGSSLVATSVNTRTELQTELAKFSMARVNVSVYELAHGSR